MFVDESLSDIFLYYYTTGNPGPAIPLEHYGENHPLRIECRIYRESVLGPFVSFYLQYHFIQDHRCDRWQTNIDQTYQERAHCLCSFFIFPAWFSGIVELSCEVP